MLSCACAGFDRLLISIHKLHAPSQFLHSRRALDDCGAELSYLRHNAMMTLALLSDFGVVLGRASTLIVEPCLISR